MNLLSLRKLTFPTLFIFSILIPGFTYGQSSLPEKYREMMDKSETYEVYKVIKTTRLNTFWGEVVDTLSVQRAEISNLNRSIADLSRQIREQQSKIDSISTDLTASLDINNSINFLGIDFQKGVYHTFVWAIIAGIAIALVVVFGMFKRSTKVTSKTQKEYQHLETEFETHKDQSHEKYLKIKRELQTAVNKLEEMRKSKSSRSGIKEAT